MKYASKWTMALCIFIIHIDIISGAELLLENQRLIRIKLQTLQFGFREIAGVKVTTGYDTTDEEAQHLARLMRESSPKTNLDLTFSHQMYSRANFNPYTIQRKMCDEFHATRVVQPLTNTFFLVNDDVEMDSMSADRGIEYILYLLGSMRVPTITWFPDRAGQLENSEHSMALRLEPMNWHIARALVDFMRAYNWNVVTVIVSMAIPDHKVFIKEFKKVQQEQNENVQSENFEFTISKIFLFRGMQLKDIRTCIDKGLKCMILRSLIIILERIYKNNDRIIIFHCTAADMITMLRAVKMVAIGPRRYLLNLFGDGYLWIGTPAFMNPIEATKRSVVLQQDSIIIQNWIGGLKVPGMFFISSLNHFSIYKEKASFVRQLWQKSLLKLVQFIDHKYPNNSEMLRDSIVPKSICRKNISVWNFGKQFYRILKSETVEFNGENIGFLPSGAVNTTTMFIFNSKIVENRMNWVKVGTWSMSSKWGRKKSRIRIDGVTWPGDSNKPPKGRPDKFKLKVATIQETPFVIYGKVQDNGKCDANAIPCRIRPKEADTYLDEKTIESNEEEDTHQDFIKDKLSNSSQNVNANLPMYIPACCAGFTIDLLNELMKDLNFMVDLFEVPDGKWGGWTPEGWNGLVKVLMDHKADMVVTSLKITPNRSEQIDFSVPFMETGIAIIVALRKGAISPTAFLEPYDFPSWCVILIFSVHACGAAVFIYEWLSPQGLDRGNALTKDHKFSLFRSLWLIWSMLFGAAVNTDNPRGVASRFLANIWALFALVFLASYTANLAAFMIAKDDYYNLEGIKDWRLTYPKLHKPTFRFATVPSGATEENIKINFPKMYGYIRNFNKSTVDEGIKAVKSGEIDAFVYDSNVLDYKAAKDKKCKLKTVGNLYAMTGYGIGFPRGSKWRNKINELILHYERYGKLQRWKKFWMTGQCHKVRSIDSTSKTLGVTNFISAFILLLVGMVLGCILLLLEHIFYRYVKSQVRDVDKYGCCRLVSLSVGQLMSFDQTVNKTIDLVKNNPCSSIVCYSAKLQTDCENKILRDKILQLESTISNMKLYDHMTRRISNQEIITEKKFPITGYQTVPNRSKSTQVPSDIKPSRPQSTVYTCHNKPDEISQYCPRHVEMFSLPKPSKRCSVNYPTDSMPASVSECQFQSPDPDVMIKRNTNRYKIIKSKLPQKIYKFSNGSNSPFVSALSKLRKRKNELLEKESCL